MTDNTEPTIDDLMKSLRPVLGMCDDDSCPSNCKKQLKGARKLIKAYVSDQVAKARGCTTCGKLTCDNCERLWQT